MANEQEELVGLDHLDDETLAAIVRNDINENGAIKTCEARIAFQELARRSGHDLGR